MRSNRYILFAIIVLCLVVDITAAATGFLFGERIITILAAVNFPDIHTSSIWLPAVAVPALLIATGWGIALAFTGITSLLMTARTTGKIIESTIQSYYDSDEGDIYFINSAVEYTVKGRRYRGEGMHHMISTDREEVDRTRETMMKPGDVVTIVYNPDDPRSMTLEKEDVNPWGEIMTGIAFLTGGPVISIVLGIYFMRFV